MTDPMGPSYSASSVVDSTEYYSISSSVLPSANENIINTNNYVTKMLD